MRAIPMTTLAAALLAGAAFTAPAGAACTDSVAAHSAGGELQLAQLTDRAKRLAPQQGGANATIGGNVDTNNDGNADANASGTVGAGANTDGAGAGAGGTAGAGVDAGGTGAAGGAGAGAGADGGAGGGAGGGSQ